MGSGAACHAQGEVLAFTLRPVCAGRERDAGRHGDPVSNPPRAAVHPMLGGLASRRRSARPRLAGPCPLGPDARDPSKAPSHVPPARHRDALAAHASPDPLRAEPPRALRPLRRGRDHRRGPAPPARRHPGRGALHRRPAAADLRSPRTTAVAALHLQRRIEPAPQHALRRGLRPRHPCRHHRRRLRRARGRDRPGLRPVARPRHPRRRRRLPPRRGALGRRGQCGRAAPDRLHHRHPGAGGRWARPWRACCKASAPAPRARSLAGDLGHASIGARP
jgi:hypothetical protein